MRRSLDQLPTHQATTDQPPGSGGRADCRASHSASGKSTRAYPSCPDAETRSATIDHLVVRPPAWSQWGNDAVRREARKATWKWDAGTCSGAPGDVSSTTWGKKQQAEANSVGIFPPNRYYSVVVGVNNGVSYGALHRTPGGAQTSIPCPWDKPGNTDPTWRLQRPAARTC